MLVHVRCNDKACGASLWRCPHKSCSLIIVAISEEEANAYSALIWSSSMLDCTCAIDKEQYS